MRSSTSKWQHGITHLVNRNYINILFQKVDVLVVLGTEPVRSVPVSDH